MKIDERGRLCLDEGEPVAFHIASWKLERVNVAPRGATQRIFQNALVLKLDELGGIAGEFEYRVTSERLARAMKPLLDSGAFERRVVAIRPNGTGRLRTWDFATAPRETTLPPQLHEFVPA